VSIGSYLLEDKLTSTDNIGHVASRHV